MMLCAACVASAANYLTFTAAEDGSTFGIKNTYNDPDVQYSLDDGATWTILADGDSIALAKKGDKALLKGNNPEGFSHDYLNCTQFVMSGSISASGSVMSLIDGVGESLTIPSKGCFYYLFSNCESLIQAPELPATTLKDSCYAYMFYFCTNLEKAAELPATELTPGCYMSMFACCRRLTEVPLMPATVMARRCYDSMFLGCYSLRKTPDLIATTLAKGCYTNMFCYCKGLKEVGELPATELADSCYYSMFQTCDSLVVLPELPATQLAPSCYNSMFEYCVSLTEAPELPATKMAELCYYNMFSNCYSLKKAPELISTELAARCYNFMFTGCQNLSELKVYFTDLNLEYVDYGSMLSGVIGPGKFICPSQFPADSIRRSIPYLWTVEYFEEIDTTANYLTFTAEEDGSSFGIVNNDGNLPNIRYSLDGGATWTALAGGDTIVLAKKGDKAVLRGNNPNGFSQSWSSHSNFVMTGKIAASGSVMSLIDVDGLSTEIPNEYCFRGLFLDCASLTQAPELPATTLAMDCYNEMFAGCTGLTQAPELPATTVIGTCYNGMFKGCTSLMKAPALPATTLDKGSYLYMFTGCTSLSEINVSCSSWNDGTPDWVKDVAPTGTFICPKALPLEYGDSRIPEGWTVRYIDDTTVIAINYLSFTSEEEGSSFQLVNNNGNTPNVEYSLDGGNTWKTLTDGKPIVLGKGTKALLRGNNPMGFSMNGLSYSNFSMTGKITAKGSVMSLVDGNGMSTVIPNGHCFLRLFEGCKALTKAPELPATTLKENCYDHMFKGCSGLKQASALPATTMEAECYHLMFSGCTGLTQAPELPATTLAEGCYEAMFEECTGLTQAPELPATTLADYCYDGMFGGCTNLTQAPALPAINLTQGCYGAMFENCTRLTQAPELPATTLAGSCYLSMFAGCTSLTQAPALPATTVVDYCYSRMFQGCTSLTEAPALPAMVVENRCYGGMFGGCTSLTKAPALPATTLAVGCYEIMFGDCTGLLQAPALPATTLAERCYNNMFHDCVGLTEAPALPATTLAASCYNRMFHGCVGLTKAPALPVVKLAVECCQFMFGECKNLSEISVSFEEWEPEDAVSATEEWVSAVAPTGTFICPKALPIEYGEDRIPNGWTVKYIEEEPNCLTFTAEEDNVSVAVTEGEAGGGDIQPAPYTQRSDESAVASVEGEKRPAMRRNLPMSTDLKYSTDGGETWTEMVPGTPVTLVKKGDKILFKGNNPSGFSTETQRIQFDIEGTASASGSVMSLIDEVGEITVIPNEYCFANLFENCAGLTEMPDLSATELKAYCYKDMFRGCTSLTSTTELPATTLEEGSYEGMFYDCENLSEVSVSFSDWADGTEDWLYGVAPEGKLFSPANLAPTVGDDYVPDGWALVPDSILTGVSDALADGLTVWTDGLTVYVCGAKGIVSLYDASGRSLTSNYSTDEERALSVPAKGVYVLRANGGSSVVLVR